MFTVNKKLTGVVERSQIYIFTTHPNNYDNRQHYKINNNNNNDDNDNKNNH